MTDEQSLLNDPERSEELEQRNAELGPIIKKRTIISFGNASNPFVQKAIVMGRTIKSYGTLRIIFFCGVLVFVFFGLAIISSVNAFTNADNHSEMSANHNRQPQTTHNIQKPAKNSKDKVQILFIRHPQSAANAKKNTLAWLNNQGVQDSPISEKGKKQLQALLDATELNTFLDKLEARRKLPSKYEIECSPLARATLAALFMWESLELSIHVGIGSNSSMQFNNKFTFVKEWQEDATGLIKGPASKTSDVYEKIKKYFVDTPLQAPHLWYFFGWLDRKYSSEVPLTDLSDISSEYFLNTEVEFTHSSETARFGPGEAGRRTYMNTLLSKLNEKKTGAKRPLRIVGGHSNSFKSLVDTYGTAEVKTKYANYCAGLTQKENKGKIPNTAVMYIEVSKVEGGAVKITHFEDVYTPKIGLCTNGEHPCHQKQIPFVD